MVKRLRLNDGVYYERDGVGYYPTLRNLIIDKVETFNIDECLSIIEYIKQEISEAETLTRKLVSYSLFEMLYFGSRLDVSETEILSKAVVKVQKEMSKEIADYVLSCQIGR